MAIDWVLRDCGREVPLVPARDGVSRDPAVRGGRSSVLLSRCRA
jgi:hypothetical protein